MLIRLCAIAALLLLPFSEANAADLKLSYQAVMHINKSRAAPVLDDKTHVIGIGAFRGIAIFPGEEPVQHRYDGWFDLQEGSGQFHGYALWTFADGSTLRASYMGQVELIAGDDAEVAAQFQNFTGTGSFQQVQGQGSFAGRRFEAIKQGGTTYLKGELSLQNVQ